MLRVVQIIRVALTEKSPEDVHPGIRVGVVTNNVRTSGLVVVVKERGSVACVV